MSERAIREFEDKEFRDAYVDAHVRLRVALQIRALREDPARQWSQSNLSTVIGTPQSVISRLENPDYGRVTVSTLLALAAAFDVALEVRFVDFATFLANTSDTTEVALRVPPHAALT